MTSFEKTPDPLRPAPGPRAPIDRTVALTRTATDRTLYQLADIGWLQTGGFFGGSEVNVQADGVTWRCGKSGFFGTVFAAKNQAGEIDGTFTGSLFGGGGTVTWTGLPAYKLQKTGLFRARYLLMDGRVILCEFAPGAGAGADAYAVVHLRREGIPAGLVMFGTYLARELRRRQNRSGGFGGGSFESSGGGGGCGGGCGGGS